MLADDKAPIPAPLAVAPKGDVSPRLETSVPIFRASSAFARASAGLGRPRSANTLSLPTTHFCFAIVLYLAFADCDGLLKQC